MLPPDFQFSSKVLQTYSDCPRRFELQYLLRQPWPAIESQPIIEMEQNLDLGRNFHRMVQQKISGVPVADLTSGLEDPLLLKWWQVFLDLGPKLDLEYCTAESTFTTQVNGYTLTAQYDLLQRSGENRIEIIDWKTTSYPLSKNWLKKRYQTCVYLFVMGKNGHQYFHKKYNAEEISLRYWFPQHPALDICFPYSSEQLQHDEETLSGVIHEISDHRGSYQLTSDVKKCEFCQYRSLCDRGVKPGSLSSDVELSSMDDVIPDLDQIEEIQI